MTALDQAFIKAFSQQGTCPVVPSRQSAAPAVEPGRAAVVSKPEAAPSPISDVFRDVLATLEKPLAPPASPTETEVPPKVLPWRSGAEAIAETWTADCWQNVARHVGIGWHGRVRLHCRAG